MITRTGHFRLKIAARLTRRITNQHNLKSLNLAKRLLLHGALTRVSHSVP